MPHAHQPGQALFRSVRPEDIEWKPFADQFDEDRLHAYPPGSVLVLPGDTFHFHWAKSGENGTQVGGIGPLGAIAAGPVLATSAFAQSAKEIREPSPFV